MSQENVEIVQAMIDDVKRRDYAPAIRAYDNSVELDVTRMPEGRLYHGRAGVAQYFGDWFGAWDALRVEPERMIDAGDNIVVFQHISGRGKATGAPVSMRTIDVFTFRNRKIVRHVGYLDSSEALKAVGLEE